MGNKNSSERRSSLYLNSKQMSRTSISDYLGEDEEDVNVNHEKQAYLDLRLCFNEKNHFHRQEVHYLLKKVLFQYEFSSPVTEKLIKGGKVLDVGCGTGCFLLDVAGRYPESKFTGIDIDPAVFPETIHDNLEFTKHDMFKGLPFPDNEFDLVNVGSIVFSITPDEIKFLIKEMIRVCKPNGYIEFDETHMTHNSKGVGLRFGQLLYGFSLVAKSYGADNNIALKLPELLSNPATDNVDCVKRRLVLGPNGGNLGIMIQEVFNWFDNSCESFINDVCKQLNISKEQYNQLLEDTTKELAFTFPEVTFIDFF